MKDLEVMRADYFLKVVRKNNFFKDEKEVDKLHNSLMNLAIVVGNQLTKENTNEATERLEAKLKIYAENNNLIYLEDNTDGFVESQEIINLWDELSYPHKEANAVVFVGILRYNIFAVSGDFGTILLINPFI